jgi:hypothetical protein
MKRAINIFNARKDYEHYQTFQDFVTDPILARKCDGINFGDALIALNYNTNTGGYKWSRHSPNLTISGGFKGRAAHQQYQMIKKLLEGQEFRTSRTYVGDGPKLDLIINLGGRRFYQGLVMVARDYDCNIINF